MTDPTQPHDKLFRGLLDLPGTADAFIRERLPADVVALLSDDPPEAGDGTYVDVALRHSQSDRLFRARLKTGTEAAVFVLIDHKSTPEPGILLQLLGYMVRIWRRRSEGQANAPRSLPPILPLVVYHGATPWTVALSLRNTIDAPHAVKQHQPDLRYQLIDLGPINPPALSAYPPLRAGLLVLKCSHEDADMEAACHPGVTARMMTGGDVADATGGPSSRREAPQS